LVLQSLFAGLAGLQFAAFAPSGDELCLHSAYDGAPTPLEPPDKQADHKVHCPLCLTGGSPAATPLPSSVPRFVAIDRVRAHWPTDEGGNSSAADYLSNPPRGPPVTA